MQSINQKIYAETEKILSLAHQIDYLPHEVKQIIYYYCTNKQYVKGCKYINKILRFVDSVDKWWSVPVADIFTQIKPCADTLFTLRRRKVNLYKYKEIIEEVIRLNRLLCFDMVYVIKDFLI